MRWLTRDPAAIEQLAVRLAPILRARCAGFDVAVESCLSQVGSGALPIDSLDSTALKISRPGARRSGRALPALALALRQLPTPVIGRISDDALWLDLRCLDDEADFIDNLQALKLV